MSSWVDLNNPNLASVIILAWLLLLAALAAFQRPRSAFVATVLAIRSFIFAGGVAFARTIGPHLTWQGFGAGRTRPAPFAVGAWALALVAVLTITASDGAHIPSDAALAVVLCGLLFSAACLLSALSVLHHDYRIINGLDPENPADLERARAITDHRFVMLMAGWLLVCVSAAMYLVDRRWQGTILATPVGHAWVYLDYMLATIHALPGGVLVFFPSTAYRAIEFAEPWGRVLQSVIFVATNVFIIGLLIFLFQQRSEAKRLAARLTTCDDKEYRFLIDRAKRTPAYFRGYVVSHVAERPEQTSYGRVHKIGYDLGLGVAPQMLLNHFHRFGTGADFQDLLQLTGELDRDATSKSARVLNEVRKAAAYQIDLLSKSDEDFQGAELLIPPMIYAIAKLVEEHGEPLPSLLVGRTREAAIKNRHNIINCVMKDYGLLYAAALPPFKPRPSANALGIAEWHTLPEIEQKAYWAKAGPAWKGALRKACTLRDLLDAPELATAYPSGTNGSVSRSVLDLPMEVRSLEEGALFQYRPADTSRPQEHFAIDFDAVAKAPDKLWDKVTFALQTRGGDLISYRLRRAAIACCEELPLWRFPRTFLEQVFYRSRGRRGDTIAPFDEGLKLAALSATKSIITHPKSNYSDSDWAEIGALLSGVSQPQLADPVRGAVADALSAWQTANALRRERKNAAKPPRAVAERAAPSVIPEGRGP